MTAPYMRNLGMCEELTLKNKGGRVLQKQIDRSIGLKCDVVPKFFIFHRIAAIHPLRQYGTH
jgi:hypothetical protein